MSTYKPIEADSKHFALFAGEIKNENLWILDSGATDHMINSRNLFENYKSNNESEQTINVADGTKQRIFGKGEWLLWVHIISP